MSKLIECLKNPPRQIYATGTPIDMERHYKAWEQSILATLRAEGWLTRDEVLARLPKKINADVELEKHLVSEKDARQFKDIEVPVYNIAIDRCTAAVKGAAITQTGGADEANHKS